MVVVLMVVLIAGAFTRWHELLAIKTTQRDEYGESVVALAKE